jgi:DNA-binding NtrC family response regulator
MSGRVLVVDDDELARESLKSLLELDGYEVEAVGDGKSALQALRSAPPRLLITDMRLPDIDGLELLTLARAERLPFGVIVLTAFGDHEVALEAMKTGADDFLTKPGDPERIRLSIQRTLDRRRLADELVELRSKMREDHRIHNMLSKSAKMRLVFDLIEQVGPRDSTVLIQGETGTGKELVAQAIHAAGELPRRPFVAVNCAALKDELLESELFGHERGAFTDADRQRKGRFEQADGGTLFLDEIGEVSTAMQVKLLRVLQNGRFERVGGNESQRVRVRLIAATNKKLDEEVLRGRFRSDLYYRLNVVRIDVPPLRERREDIPLLSTHFLERLSARSTPAVTEIDPAAMLALLEYSWPGNVRELENAIKSAVALADGTVIRRENLPTSVVPDGARDSSGVHLDLDRPLPEVADGLITNIEKEYFNQLLERYAGNVAQCARHSGLSRRCVTLKLQKLRLDRRKFKRTSQEVSSQSELAC